jgi:hypothetical protein
MIKRRGLRLFNRLWGLAGRLIKPVWAERRFLPRFWARTCGSKRGGFSLYQQDFSGLELGELLLVINRELPGGKKEGVGKRVCCPAPGAVRVSGGFLWMGKSREGETAAEGGKPWRRSYSED